MCFCLVTDAFRITSSLHLTFPSTVLLLICFVACFNFPVRVLSSWRFVYLDVKFEFDILSHIWKNLTWLLIDACCCMLMCLSWSPWAFSYSGLECMLISWLGILYHTDKLRGHEWQWPVLRLWPQRQTCFSIIVRKGVLRFLFFLWTQGFFFFFFNFGPLINYFKCCMLSNISVCFWWGKSPVFMQSVFLVLDVAYFVFTEVCWRLVWVIFNIQFFFSICRGDLSVKFFCSRLLALISFQNCILFIIKLYYFIIIRRNLF